MNRKENLLRLEIFHKPSTAIIYQNPFQKNTHKSIQKEWLKRWEPSSNNNNKKHKLWQKICSLQNEQNEIIE